MLLLARTQVLRSICFLLTCFLLTESNFTPWPQLVKAKEEDDEEEAQETESAHGGSQKGSHLSGPFGIIYSTHCLFMAPFRAEAHLFASVVTMPH